jgi:hypothetical protein
MLVKGLLKKTFVVLFALVLLAGVSAGGGSDSGAQGAAGSGPALKPVKIAVAFWLIDPSSLLVQKYLREYVSPALNVEFMFSEAVDNADKLMTFMENAYAAGCQGIINYQNSSVPQAIAKANELGMYIATNASFVEENKEFPYNMGFVAADAAGVANSFGELVRDLVNDGQKHSIVIVSAGSAFGNQEHYEATVAILRTLEGVYGLKYARDIKDLAVSRAETQADNDKDVKIVIYPGYPTGNTYVTGMSALLQTGDYDTILACNAAYARFSVAVDEVEKAYKKDIRVSAITMINDQTKTSFITQDSFGRASLNSAILNPSVSLASGLFALVYNGITGHADKVRINNAAAFYDAPKWKCNSPDEYARIEKIDVSNDTWEVNMDELKKLLVVFNPSANAQSIYKQLESVTAEFVLKARGL